MASRPRPPTPRGEAGPVSPARLEAATRTFALLGDPTRFQIVWQLRAGELSVNDLAGRVDKAAATVSQHLAKLRLAGVVQARRDGNHIYYRLADNHVGELVEDAVHHAAHVAED